MKKILCGILTFTMLVMTACGSAKHDKEATENTDKNSKAEYVTGTVFSIEDNSLDNPTKTTVIIKSGDVYYLLYSNYEGRKLNFAEGKNYFAIGDQLAIEYTGELKEHTDSDGLVLGDSAIIYDLDFEHIVEVSVSE